VHLAPCLHRLHAFNPLLFLYDILLKICRKRFLDANDLKDSMEGKLFLKPSLIRPTMNIADDRDWVTIAVVARCNDPQTAKTVSFFVYIFSVTSQQLQTYKQSRIKYLSKLEEFYKIKHIVQVRI